MRRVAVPVVVVVLFRRQASDIFQEAISWGITGIFLLVIPQVCCFWPFSVNLCYSSSKQTENVSSFWSSSRMVLMFETRFLPLLHLCEVSENCFIRLGHDWNNFYENIDLFQKRSLYVPVWLSWFRCIYLTWTRNIERYGKVFAPLLLIAFHWQIFFFFGFFL